MKNIVTSLFLISLFSFKLFGQETISATFSGSDIPTFYDDQGTVVVEHDRACSGQPHFINITLPTVDPSTNIVVTRVNTIYVMEASPGSDIADQLSKIYFQNNDISESEWIRGAGSGSGTEIYTRSFDIANGSYTSGEVLSFEMWAVRQANNLSPDLCSFADHKVILGTWSIEVEYTYSYAPVNKVGVNTTSPEASLDVSGKLKIGDDSEAPVEGMIRYNPSTKDFEGYNGVNWLSFTSGDGSASWGSNKSTEDFHTEDVGSHINLGVSVGIYGEYAILGGSEPSGDGMVRTYRKYGDDWVSIGGPVGPHPTSYFGHAVDINENWVAVGAYKESEPSGRVYIYTYGPTGLTPVEDFNLGGVEYFGESLELSGDNLIVGARKDNIDDGAAALYTYDPFIPGWTQKTFFTSSELMDEFGYDVAIDGNYIAVSAPNASDNYTVEGKVYLFQKIGLAWVPMDTLSSPEPIENGQFGFSISLNGDEIAISQPAYAGAVYVFKRSGSQWNHTASITSDRSSIGDGYGLEVHLSGDYLVVGASLNDVNGNEKAGSAYLYERNNDSWTEVTTFVPSNSQANGLFSDGIDIYEDTIIIGESGRDEGSFVNTGRAYFFYKN